jgi:DNA-binding GntR family transcriptional regulator
MGVLQKLHQHSDRYFRMQVLLAGGGHTAGQEHRAIAAAVRKGDVKTATQLMRSHILGAGQSLLELLHAQRNGSATPASVPVVVANADR